MHFTVTADFIVGIVPTLQTVVYKTIGIYKSIGRVNAIVSEDSTSVVDTDKEQDCCGFTLSAGHFLIPPPPFTSKRICVTLLFLTLTVRAKVPVRRSRRQRERKKKEKRKAQWFSPWSHSQTLSSLHDVIGSMLGVLLQSLVQFQAVLADLYFSGLLEEGKVETDLESDDDEWHSFPQVQVRVSLLLANSAELSGST